MEDYSERDERRAGVIAEALLSGDAQGLELSVGVSIVDIEPHADEFRADLELLSAIDRARIRRETNPRC